MGFVVLLSYIVPFQAGANHRARIRSERNSWPEYNFRTGVFEREPVPTSGHAAVCLQKPNHLVCRNDRLVSSRQESARRLDELAPASGTIRFCVDQLKLQ